MVRRRDSARRTPSVEHGAVLQGAGGEARNDSGGASVGSVRWVLGFEADWFSSQPCIKRFQMVCARIGHKRYTGTTTEFPPKYECEGMMGDSFEASKKRSDEIRADLSVNPGKYCMLTGDRPTGRLHLGHYFGTIRELSLIHI